VAVNNVAAMSADNPWLTIPLADYEAHMALPQVAAQLLADLFAAGFARAHRPPLRQGLRAGDTRTTATGGKGFAVQSFAAVKSRAA
jgi:hypothetical protein